MRNTVRKTQKGDILLCYLTGVMRWIGALEVVGPSADGRPIWKDADFPARLDVRPVVMVDAEFGVPMKELAGRVEFYRGPEDRSKFRGFVRRSPNLFSNPADGELILDLLREAERNPVSRPVDPKKLARKPLYKVDQRRGKKAVKTLVSIPDTTDTVDETTPSESPAQPSLHTETQHRLLRLGADMGFDVWVAVNDRGKVYNGQELGRVPRSVSELPTQFNDATNKTVERIDVLWLRGNSIVAAFEVECTTSVYSGLLRMSDLLALQPNLKINLYIVAPDERRGKVEEEILRPTFKLRERPLLEACGFLPIPELIDKIDGARKLGLIGSLKPEFLDSLAEYFSDEPETDEDS